MSRRILPASLLLLAALTATACGASPSHAGRASAAPRTLTGTVEWEDPGIDSALIRHQEPCRTGGSSGYDDLSSGGDVTITDGSGRIVAVATLAAPRFDASDSRCALTFRAAVPQAAFYGLEVTHRGVVRYSRADLARDGWRVALSVG